MDDKRRIVIKRLRKARRNEMTCLSYWEIEILLNYINELERKVEKDGSSEIQA